MIALFRKRRFKNDSGSSMEKNRLSFNDNPDLSGIFLNDNGPLHDEEFFERLLILERKRTERSKTSFMLLLIDITELRNRTDDPHTIKKLIHEVYYATRETDLKGWYDSFGIIGIIFTEFNMMSIDAILNKMNSAFSNVLTPGHCSLIHVSHFIFPEGKT